MKRETDEQLRQRVRRAWSETSETATRLEWVLYHAALVAGRYDLTGIRCSRKWGAAEPGRIDIEIDGSIEAAEHLQSALRQWTPYSHQLSVWTNPFATRTAP